MDQGFKEMLVKSNLYGTQLSEKESIEKMVKRWNSDFLFPFQLKPPIICLRHPPETWLVGWLRLESAYWLLRTDSERGFRCFICYLILE